MKTSHFEQFQISVSTLWLWTNQNFPTYVGMLVNQLDGMIYSWWTSLDWTKIVGITVMIGPKGELILGNRYIPSILLVIEHQ